MHGTREPKEPEYQKTLKNTKNTFFREKKTKQMLVFTLAWHIARYTHQACTAARFSRLGEIKGKKPTSPPSWPAGLHTDL